MNACTEIQEYVCRFISMNPEKDIAVVDCEDRVEIYSIGEDDALYLTYEEDGGAARYSRVRLRENVKEIAVAYIAATGKRVIAYIEDEEIYLAVTGQPHQLRACEIEQIDRRGLLGGKKMTPVDLHVTALEQGITLFIEMREETGRIEQFACILDSEHPDAVKYFPLASNFTSVQCSAGGRAYRQYVDGIYTFGEYGGTKQLLYTPSYNIFGDSQPAPLRFQTDSDIEAICTYPLSGETGTQLFAVGGSHLYWYPFERQVDMYHTDQPAPDLLASSELFYGAKKIAAAIFGEQLYIYVLNESNILSYTYGKYQDDLITEVQEPVILREEVYYFDLGNDGTMNICGKEKAVFGTQDKVTGHWTFSEADIETKLDTYKTMTAYVTKINVGMDDSEAVLFVKEAETASCYVNGSYHRFDRLSVRPDVTGSITIVQEAKDFNPPCFEVQWGAEKLFVNPADHARRELLKLTDAEQARREVITSLDGKEQTKLFEGIDDEHLHAVVSGISAVGSSVEAVRPDYIQSPGNTGFEKGIALRMDKNELSVAPYDSEKKTSGSFLSKVVNNVEYAFNWIKSKLKWLYDHTIGPAVDFVLAKIQGVWKFIVKVGEKVLEVVVKTVKCAFGALKKLLELLGVPVDKILSWMKKIFHIEETEKVNEAMKKMIRASGQALVAEAGKLKGAAVKELDRVIDSVAEWAKIDLSEGGRSVGHTVNTGLKNISYASYPHGNYMFDLIFGRSSFDEVRLPEFEITDGMRTAVHALETTVRQIEDDLDDVTGTAVSILDDMGALLHAENIFDVCSYLKKILGKTAVAGLKLCKTILDGIFGVLAAVLEGMIAVLLEQIHIPFLSQVLKLFGVAKFSVADIFTFPIAFFMVNGMSLAGDSKMVETACDVMSNWKLPQEILCI